VRFFYLALLLLMIATTAMAETIKVHFPYTLAEGDNRDAYFLKVLDLAMTYADTDSVQLVPVNTTVTKSRALLEMQRGRQFDLVWSMTSTEREKHLLPVRIPLMRGLLGHRLFLIRENDQHRFDDVSNLDELSLLIAGQGHDWPDTRILRANSLDVRTSTRYQNLFHMLRMERFDYFPRSVAEIWPEMKAQAGQGIVLEDGLALRYPAPIYFFVRQDARELADILEDGLRAAISDGALQRLLREHPDTAPIFEHRLLEERRILDLENPLLPPETPLDEKALWLDDAQWLGQ